MHDNLFNPPNIEKLIAFDIFGNQHQRLAKNFKMRVSVYGLLEKGDEVLVQRNPEISEYSLPGGGVEIGESIEEALVREVKEETGISVMPIQLLDVGHDFFTWNDEDAHTILILFRVKYVSGSVINEFNNNDSVEALYIPKTQLLQGNLQRVFLKFEKHLRD